MKYLFTNKKVKIGDICRVLCDKEHLKSLHISKYFNNIETIVQTINVLGIKIIETSETKCKGYMVYHLKDSDKIIPYYICGKRIYLNITSDNNIGLMKWNKHSIHI